MPKSKKPNVKVAAAAAAAAAATAATDQLGDMPQPQPVDKQVDDAAVLSSDSECAEMSPFKKQLFKLKKKNAASASKRLRMDSDDDDEQMHNYTVFQLLTLKDKTKIDLIAKVMQIEEDHETYGLKEGTVLLLLADATGSVLAELQQKAVVHEGDSIQIAGAWFFPIEQRVRVAKDASIGSTYDPVKVKDGLENESVATAWTQHFKQHFRQVATIKQLDPQQEKSKGSRFNIRGVAILVRDKQTWPGSNNSGPADYRVLLIRDDKGDCIEVTFWRGDAIRQPKVGSVLEIANLRLNMFHGERTLNSYEGMTQVKVVDMVDAADLSVPTRYKRVESIIKIKSISRQGLLVYPSCVNKSCFYTKLKTDRSMPYCHKCMKKYEAFQGAKQGVKVDAVVTMETDEDGKVKRKVKLFTEAVGKLLEGGLGDYDESVTADDLHAAFALPIAVTGSISGDVLTIKSVHPHADT